eukprot:SAG25_NODE_7317_length_488_cov_1.455013_2_plen_39_part_01
MTIENLQKHTRQAWHASDEDGCPFERHVGIGQSHNAAKG